MSRWIIEDEVHGKWKDGRKKKAIADLKVGDEVFVVVLLNRRNNYAGRVVSVGRKYRKVAPVGSNSKSRGVSRLQSGVVDTALRALA